MEPVVEKFTEYYFDCKILAENRYIAGPNRTCYSPDGLTVIRRNGAPCITLLEFKAPYSRIPDGKVPKYYIPQIKMGLELIPICQAGLYIECVLRRCSWGDFGFGPEFDRTLTPKGGKDKALACGVIIFHTTSESLEDMVAAELGGLGVDLGSSTEDLFVRLLNSACNGDVTLQYGEVLTNGDRFDRPGVAPAIDKEVYLRDTLDSKKCLGYLPYKLFTVGYNWVNPQPGFLEPYFPRIKAVTDCIDYCLDPANSGRVDNVLRAFAEEWMG